LAPPAAAHPPRGARGTERRAGGGRAQSGGGGSYRLPGYGCARPEAPPLPINDTLSPLKTAWGSAPKHFWDHWQISTGTPFKASPTKDLAKGPEQYVTERRASKNHLVTIARYIYISGKNENKI
jgi:hypothetical protein